MSAERKNPHAVVDAFRHAFSPGEGPTLVLKSINGRERKPRQLEQLQAAVADRPDILVVDGYVSVAERDSFVAACDCFVSLHRSEGFGLTMAEAMSHGKPVIATGYSGNLEFMDDSTAYLVPYKLVPVPDDWWAYAPGALWAEPDVQAAAAAMREVFAGPERARAVGQRARSAILRRFSIERTTEFVARRYRTVRALPRSTASTEQRADVLRAANATRTGAERGISDRSGRGPPRAVATARRPCTLAVLRREAAFRCRGGRRAGACGAG